MTAATYVTIWCDEAPDSPEMNCGVYIEDDSAKEGRAQAKRAGWQVGVRSATGRGLRDYCPDHRLDRSKS